MCDFKQRVVDLLAQRAQLRQFGETYRIARMRTETDDADRVVRQIVQFVIAPLGLTAAEKPADGAIATAALAILYGHTVDFAFDHWPQRLRDRLVLLAGPVEPTIRRMLGEHEQDAAA
ncbi:MAG TPA: hypothetical protein VGI19_18620 [Candidatus Cybelea sp.]|jgi:hypothetical protein